MNGKVKFSARIEARNKKSPVESVSDNELERLRKAEFYAANCAGWFNTALERDKSILTLSAGGIALLVGLATSKGFASVIEVVLFILALLSFFVSLILILAVFKANKGIIEATIAERDGNEEKTLKRLDQAATLAFGLGALISVTIGISSSVDSLIEKKLKEIKDSQITCIKKEKELDMSSEDTTRKYSQESFTDLKNLKPEPTLKKSYDGIQNLKPGQSSQQTSKPAQPAASSPTKKND